MEQDCCEYNEVVPLQNTVYRYTFVTCTRLLTRYFALSVCGKTSICVCMILGYMSRYCSIKGTWHPPVYACVRQEIADAGRQVMLIAIKF